MKKKLALAAALMPNPDLLFLDEPFEGVDAVASRMLRDMLLQFVNRGTTVFLTSHVLEIVEKLCTHVGIIAQGRLVLQASMDDVRQNGTSLLANIDSTRTLARTPGTQDPRNGDPRGGIAPRSSPEPSIAQR
jgi:ABC-type multidrug transport system ATPase subunit